MESLPVVPLWRAGRPYYTRLQRLVRDARGEPLAWVCQAPPAFYADALEGAAWEGWAALRELPWDRLLAVLRAASLHLTGSAYGGAEGPAPPGPAGRPAGAGTPSLQEPALPLPGTRAAYEAHLQRVVLATGMPYTWVRASYQHLASALRHLDEILQHQVPGGRLELLDHPGLLPGLRWVRRARHLAVLLPGNDPHVHVWWCLALALKFPLVLRPSEGDPLTPWYLAATLYSAGLPGPALWVLPGPREEGLELLRRARLALAFGGPRLAEEVGRLPDAGRIRLFGPGQSSAAVSASRADDPRVLDHLVRGVLRAGGRACFCLSRIAVVGPAEAGLRLARALAERLAALPILPPTDPRARVPALPKEEADALEGYIRQGMQAGGRDLTRDLAGRLREEVDGWHVLRPTVVWIPPGAEGDRHPLWCELPYPYCAVTAVPPDPDLLLRLLQRSLLVAAFLDEPRLRDALWEDPTLDRVYLERYPGEIELIRPHHGFLAGFLFHTGTGEAGFPAG
ncbi:aldehyde dehydrogenase family protein [Thermaerobacter sp. FW80]|uniref:aldehyde dehydrogenase family protein n=1 Tax=Thermaerobacter sp. FW80 TaxID=2546351 RepID=UPI001074CBD0|nr:aldehyde dehydrogenase family protein [Thermaerobacter sp. FW80]QBS36680.1 aldehyde dehydrogenase family protein [Thermaerobacter sp. FW80]